jgi:hypothetical protein
MRSLSFKITLLFLIPIFGWSQNDVQLVIENATYRHKQTAFRIDVHWKNNTEDTVSVIIPQLNHFKGNLYNLGGTEYVGELQKPYTITFRQEGTCEGQKDYTPRELATRKSHLYSFQVVTIPPGRKSKRIVISLFANHNFCTESKYFAQISYDPQYAVLTSKQVKKLQAHKQAFDEIQAEVKQYLKTEGVPLERRRPSRSLMETILNSNNIIESLTPVNFSTAEVEIVKQ